MGRCYKAWCAGGTVVARVCDDAVDTGVGSVSLLVVVDPSFSGRCYRIKLRGLEPTAFAESSDDDSAVARIGLRDGPRELQTPPRLMAVPARQIVTHPHSILMETGVPTRKTASTTTRTFILLPATPMGMA